MKAHPRDPTARQAPCRSCTPGPPTATPAATSAGPYTSTHTLARRDCAIDEIEQIAQRPLLGTRRRSALATTIALIRIPSLQLVEEPDSW